MNRSLVTLTLATLSVCAAATAQTVNPDPLQSFATLGERLERDDDVRVRPISGADVTGRVLRISADEIVLKNAEGERNMRGSEIREITVRHGSAGRGALIGTGVGLLWAATSSDCRNYMDSHNSCGEAVGMGVIFGAGLGALAGQLWQRHTAVYRAPAAQVFVAPSLSRHTVGVQARLLW